MDKIVYWVLNMSITATLTGSVVMLIRSFTFLPRRLTVFLWSIPFLRLLCPFGLNSPYSLLALLRSSAIGTVFAFRTVGNPTVSMTNYVMLADSYFPIVYKNARLEELMKTASIVWAVVAFAILLTLGVLYRAAMREIRDADLWKENLYFSEKVTTPAVYGIVHPKIVLPVCYRERETDLVLLHERTHIRSGDNLWRLLAFFVAAVHWFNPFVWLFLKTFFADLELSCDERVLLKLGNDRAKEYASVLVENRCRTTFASAFGGARIRDRIERILSFKKMTRFSLVCALLFVVAVFAVLLTNAP